MGYIAAELDHTGVRIGDLQVHPARRRQGVGAELVRPVVEQAAARGCARIYLETEGDDPVGARTFYERLGFHLVVEHFALPEAGSRIRPSEES